MSKLTGRAGHRWPFGLAVPGGLLVAVASAVLLSGGAAERDAAATAVAPSATAAADLDPARDEAGVRFAGPTSTEDPARLAPAAGRAADWLASVDLLVEENDVEEGIDDGVYEAGRPVRIVVPAIDVDDTVVETGLLPSGAMEVADFGLAGWYGLGSKPGEAGPAVIAAHVSSVAGPDVFYRLKELEEGDEILVEDADGATHVFTVTDSELQPKVELPTERIWSEDDEPVLRLITCGGEFGAAARSHVANVIVYAEHASR